MRSLAQNPDIAIHGHMNHMPQRLAGKVLGIFALMLVAHATASRAQAVGTALPGRVAAGEEQIVESLYRAHPGPFWNAGGQPRSQARALLAQIQAADQWGLEPQDYGSDMLTQLLLRDPNSVLLDHLLTRAAVRLLLHLHYGRVDPMAADFELPPRSRDLDIAAVLEKMTASEHLDAVLGEAEPQFEHYSLLKAALARYRHLSPSLTHLPALGVHAAHAGDSYAGAPALRTLLLALGDLKPAADTSRAGDTRIDPDLVRALQHFQARHGLTMDGTLGPATFLALTTPLPQRLRQIELTLERWRWLPPFTAPPIIVNIPQFRLFAFATLTDRAAQISQMPVIVGHAFLRTRTPVFVGQMRYVIFRPYWDVPVSITRREMLPHIRSSPQYLQANRLQIVRGPDDAATILQPTPETLSELARGQLRLRQLPGDDNSLGLVKFVLPNSHDVYLHGTPAVELFARSRRDFSHGCIRVSDPIALARYVLRNAPGSWSEETIRAAMHDRDNRSVNLAKPIPVMVLYATVLATEAGDVEFFEDIYGQDRKLEALLAEPHQ